MKKILVNTLAAALLMSPAVFADNHNSSNSCQGSNCTQMQADDLQQVFQQLDLSFAQKREMRKIKMGAQQGIRDVADQLQQNFMKLQDYSAGNYDEKAVKKLAREQGKLFAERIELDMKLRNELFNVLDKNQKTTFQKLIGASN